MLKKLQLLRGIDAPTAGDTTASHCVMIIDDYSPTIRKIVEMCLVRAGFEVQCCADGVEAIRWLRQPQVRIPDMILLDIGLPHLDGYEVALRLKGQPQLSKTIIIVLSRRDGMIDRLKCRLVGAKGSIVKPFEEQELLAVVECHLRVQKSAS